MRAARGAAWRRDRGRTRRGAPPRKICENPSAWLRRGPGPDRRGRRRAGGAALLGPTGSRRPKPEGAIRRTLTWIALPASSSRIERQRNPVAPCFARADFLRAALPDSKGHEGGVAGREQRIAVAPRRQRMGDDDAPTSIRPNAAAIGMLVGLHR